VTNETELLVDALAVARLARLVTKDVITVGPRDAVIRWAYTRDGRGDELGVDEVFVGDDGKPRPSPAPPPAEVVRTDDHPPKIARLITCPWCASVWLAGGVVVVRRLAPGVWPRVARVLAMSHVAGLVANRDG
jgi:hypothetical protein